MTQASMALDDAGTLALWVKAVGGGAGRALQHLAGVYPGGMTRAELAERGNWAATGGTFGTYLSRLRSAGLIHESGGVLTCTRIVFDLQQGE